MFDVSDEVQVVDKAYGIFTEMEDGTLNLCRCPSTWDEQGDGYRRAALYADAAPALLAFNGYREQHPDAYYAVVEVGMVMDTDLLGADPSVAHLCDLSTQAVNGDKDASVEALRILGDHASSLAGTS